MEEWNIQSRNDVCSQCQTPFLGKQPYHTVLTLASAGYQRQDLCCLCWDAQGAGTLREKAGVISCWQGVYAPRPPPSPDPLPKEDAEFMLRSMLQKNNPSEKEARYILAVMLERKRILKLREAQAQGERRLIYEHMKTGEVFIIEDPQLKLGQLEEVQQRVAAVLKTPDRKPGETANDKTSGPDQSIS